MKLLINNVHKTYKEVEALSGISLALSEGVYGLLGPNGAGKTTLMNCVAGIIKPSSGNIYFNDCDINNMGRQYRNIIGYMPQQQAVYNEFTGRMFLRYIAALKDIKKSDIKNKVEYVLEIVGLEDVAHRKIGSYSGGMKQRILIAQALLNNPKVLLLDEPTAGVDPDERIRIRNYISEIAMERIVILATHIVTDLTSVANKIVVIKRGKVVIEESPMDMINSIRGRVYEITGNKSTLNSVKKKHKVLTVINSGSDAKVRILSESVPLFENACVVEPGIEDVYLYHMKYEGI